MFKTAERESATVDAHPGDLLRSDLAELVIRARDGDPDAQKQLVRQFQGTVYAICLRRLGNSTDAQDMTQDVFLLVFTRLHQLSQPERFAGWLQQIAVRVCINRVTRRAIKTVDSDVLEVACLHTWTEESPLDGLMQAESAEQVHAALGKLKPLDRDTLIAFYFERRSLVEMAQRSDAPIGTIKRRLFDARKRLGVIIKNMGIFQDEIVAATDEDDGAGVLEVA